MPNVGYATLQVIPSVRGIADDLRRQLVGPAQEAGQHAGEESGGGFREAFEGALAALGVEAIAEKAAEAFSEAWNEALEQGQIVNKLKASLGASNAQAAQYGKIAGKLYSSGVSDSFEDAAEAIKNVAQGGLVPPGATNKQLQSIATKASDVANTFGLDFESVTNASSRLIATGLVKNTDQAFDLIATGYQQLGPKADDLLDTFNEYSVQFKKMGLSGQTALGLIDQGIKGGARDTDLVADAIKEFSIRAVDGSATTIAGFKGLGLSAKGMAEQIGKGGKGAADGLQTVLDRLRKVPDPVKRAQLATDLFGTQAEDLGSALFKLDPSKATKAVGKFGGAATQLGKDLRTGPSYQVTLFKRTLQQGFVNFLGSKVIPIISKWGGAFDKDVLPPLEKVGGILDTDFLPAVRGTVSVIAGTVDWFRKWGLYLVPLVVLVGGLTLALNAQAIASGISTAATWLGVTALDAAEAATGGFTAAQTLLNAVLALNPIALVVIALVALGAAFVVAYNKSATFRAIVQGAWAGIEAGAKDVAGWFTGSFLPFFTKTIPGAFNATIGWVRAHWPLLLGIITGPIGLATVYVVTHWHQISSGISSAWGTIKSHTLTPMETFFTKTVPGWASTLKSKVVGAFTSAATDAGKGFGKLEGLAKKPVSFVVNTVYNDGIVGVWNKIAGAFGAKKLSTYKFATGGILPGYTPGRDVHLAALSGGEAIMRPEWTRAMGPGYVNSMNALAARGGVPAVQRAMGGALPAYNAGGIFGWVGSAANAVAGAGSAAWKKAKRAESWIKDTLAASARAGVNAVVDPLIARIPGAGKFGDLARRIPKAAVNALFGYADTADKKGASSTTASGYHASTSQAQSIARTLLGRYGWGPGQMAPLTALWNGESGWRWNALNKGSGAYGIPQSLPASKMASAGKDWRDNAATQIKWGEGYIKSRYGSPAAAWAAWSGRSPHWYDAGGPLGTGLTLAANGTGKTEMVLTDQQYRAAAAAVRYATAQAQAPAGGRPAGQGLADALAGMTVVVQVGNEPIAAVARTEVYAATGELVAVLNAGGGQS